MKILDWYFNPPKSVFIAKVKLLTRICRLERDAI